MGPPRWISVPPFRERTLRDDAKVALGIFAGVTLGHFVFGRDDESVLLIYVIALAVMVVVFNLVRRILFRRLDDEGHSP